MTIDKDKMKALALAATPEHEFTADEQRLYDLMSEISEDCYCAGWMHGNEFALWDAISTGDLRYGMGEIDRALLAQVAALSIKTGKWIVWRDDNDGLDPHDTSEWGPYAVNLKEWLESRAENDKLDQERDELRAEVERVTLELQNQRELVQHWKGKAILNADFADAKRYRWWRDNWWNVSISFDGDKLDSLSVETRPGWVIQMKDGNRFDGAIDAAIAAHSKAGKQ